MESVAADIEAKVNKEIQQGCIAQVIRLVQALDEHVKTKPNEECKYTIESAVELWNKLVDPELRIDATTARTKVTLGDDVKSTNSGGASSSDSPKKRTKTDKTRKCQVPKTRGANKGEPCGKYCTEDSVFCPEHKKKNMGSGEGVSAGVSPPKATPVSAPAPSVQPQPPKASPVQPSGSNTQTTCQHILLTGANKGNPCGKPAKGGKWCTTHAKKYE